MTSRDALITPALADLAGVAEGHVLALALQRRLLSEYSNLFALRAPDRRWETDLDDAIIEELSLSYADQSGLLVTHLPLAGSVVGSVGFSSLVKTSLLIRADGVGAGKCTITIKRGGVLKLGPLYLHPRFRRRRHAMAVVNAIAQTASQLGFTRLVATVPENHAAAVTARRAGLVDVLKLREHYRADLDELVFVRNLVELEDVAPIATLKAVSTGEELLASFVSTHYHPIDQSWQRWLSDDRVRGVQDAARFVGKPHLLVGDEREAAVIIFKRGGTAKVVVAAAVGSPSRALLSECETLGRKLGQRKLAVFWPKAAGKLDTSWLYRYFAEGNVGVGRAGALVAIHSTFL